MQPLIWYARRLRGMSAGEVAWRISSALRDRVDRLRFSTGRVPSTRRALLSGAGAATEPPFRLCALPVETAGSRFAGPEEQEWSSRLRRKADAIAAHRFSFFDLEERFLGDPVEWNRDHSAGIASPADFAPSIDYRDFRRVGDAKLVWEPSRHHQLVVLARAYRAFGEKRYAEEAVRQLASWLDQCPFGTGMNWRSPLELAIRLINWSFAYDLLRDSGCIDGRFRNRFLHSAYLHLWEVRRKYSRGSSANNHSIGEAAGVLVAALSLPGLAIPATWIPEAREILENAMAEQTYGDGCNREHAFGYHAFVLQFFLVAGLAGLKGGVEFSPSWWKSLESMFDFAAALAEGGAPPSYGDCDDGYVLDLGGDGTELHGLFPVGAALFGSASLRRRSPRYSEPAAWLLGEEGRKRFDALPVPPPSAATLESRAFPESGYYLLQAGREDDPDRASVFFDCAELGFGAIAAHGHADALAFTLRIGGQDLLVDPGTYDYFTYPEWRNHFRGTAAHNTAVVDGEDQSVMEGPFLWGKRARARCLSFDATREGGGAVTGEHDGYCRLPDPVRHRRTLVLDHRSRTVEVLDELVARGHHSVSFNFHFAESCGAVDANGGAVRIDRGGRSFLLEVDPRLSTKILRGDEGERNGWVSRGYHRKEPSTSVVCSGEWNGTAQFRFALRYNE